MQFAVVQIARFRLFGDEMHVSRLSPPPTTLCPKIILKDTLSWHTNGEIYRAEGRAHACRRTFLPREGDGFDDGVAAAAPSAAGFPAP